MLSRCFNNVFYVGGKEWALKCSTVRKSNWRALDATLSWVHFCPISSLAIHMFYWAHWPTQASEPLLRERPALSVSSQLSSAQPSPTLSSQSAPTPLRFSWAAWASIQPLGFTLRLSWIRLRSPAPLALAEVERSPGSGSATGSCSGLVRLFFMAAED